jgi:putative transposase
MVARGLNEPLLVVSDKHKALRRAVKEVFPHAFKQTYLAHKMRNILSKLPRKAQKEMKPLVHRVFYISRDDEGLKLGKELIARSKGTCTSAMECLGEELEESLTYLKFPEAHWKAIRTTNLLERRFEEGRRRTKGTPLHHRGLGTEAPLRQPDHRLPDLEGGEDDPRHLVGAGDA